MNMKYIGLSIICPSRSGFLGLGALATATAGRRGWCPGRAYIAHRREIIALCFRGERLGCDGAGRPPGLDDALYADENSKAEIIIPNDTWLRTGGNTQIQLIALKRDVTEIDMASGVGRFYNRSSKGVIKVTTEFGYVIARRGTTFDLYVGDESLEVIPVTGRVDFFA